MDKNQNTNHSVTETNTGKSNYETFPDVTPGREGGDDALAESSPIDRRSDEKVIAQQEKHGTANTSSDVVQIEMERIRKKIRSGNDGSKKKDGGQQ
jgi:hypothetical protein